MRQLRQFVVARRGSTNFLNKISLSILSTLSTLSRNPFVSTISRVSMEVEQRWKVMMDGTLTFSHRRRS